MFQARAGLSVGLKQRVRIEEIDRQYGSSALRHASRLPDVNAGPHPAAAVDGTRIRIEVASKPAPGRLICHALVVATSNSCADTTLTRAFRV